MVKTALPNADKAAILLYSLPPDDAEKVLEMLGGDSAARLRELMEWYAGSPNLDELVQQVLEEFTRLQSGVLGLPTTPDEKRAAYQAAAGTRRFNDPDRKKEKAEGEADDEDKQEGEEDEEASSDGKESKDGKKKTKKKGKGQTPAAEGEVDPLDELRNVEINKLASVLKQENARIISIILHALGGDKVSQILARLPNDKRKDAFVQMAAGPPGNIDLVRRMAFAVLQKCGGDEAQEEKSDDEQYQLLADILHSVGREDRAEMMKALQSHSDLVADKVDSLLFSFEDLHKIVDRTVQKILAEVDQKTLAMAMQECEQELIDCVMGNMSERVRGMVKEEMEFCRDSPKEKIDEARKVIVNIMRRYDKEGTLTWKSA